MDGKYYLYVGLAEDKMNRDGIDIDFCFKELDKIAIFNAGIKEKAGCYSFNSIM